MALTSPGVEVTIIDQSQYLPAAGASVPFVMVATAANKANPAGTGIAQATTSANAGKLYQVTSQRDLVSLYGNPFFYQTADGTPIQGYELNEYGLLAAYSVLGVTNNCYVLRADIDLASLVGKTGRPTAAPADGTYWLDTTTTTWGIYEWNANKQSFSYKTPAAVITDEANTDGNAPLDSIGNIGDYAIVDFSATQDDPLVATSTYWYKNYQNTWVQLGSWDWLNSIPMVSGTTSNPTITVGGTITFTVGSSTYTVTATGTTVGSLANQINNALGIVNIGATSNNNVLNIYARTTSIYNTPITCTLGGSILSEVGINAGPAEGFPYRYTQPQVIYGTTAEQPLWSNSQAYPAPTGSVWVKISTVTNGLNPKLSSYDTTLAAWVSRKCSVANSDWEMTNVLDTTGGKAIPAGTVYMQVNPMDMDPSSPVYIWKRSATGATVVTGTETSPTFTLGGTLKVYVTAPGETSLQVNPNTSAPWIVTVPAGANAQGFASAWSSAAISFTTAAVDSDGAIVLTHTEGGEIVIDDHTDANYQSNGILEQAGFVAGTTTGVKFGPSSLVGGAFTTTNVASSGSGLQVTLSIGYSSVSVVNGTLPAGGTGYAVGDTVKVLGSQVGGDSPDNDILIKVMSVSGGVVTSVALAGDTPPLAPGHFTTQLSNWVFVDYIPNEGAPNVAPDDMTNWFWAVTDQVDIMVRGQTKDPDTGSYWTAYRNTNYDKNGFPKTTGTNNTDPNGPIISATKPPAATGQSDGTPLVYGDLWIDTGDLENFPVIYRWQAKKKADGSYVTPEVGEWVLLDTTDQTSSAGVLFADARWALNGDTNPANDPIPSIKSMLQSVGVSGDPGYIDANYIDVDAPTSTLYPVGMLLFNTRRSGYNVKQYRTNYLTSTNFPDKSTYPTISATWVSASGLDSAGKAYMGRKAQRNMVVKAMRSTMDTNQAIRDEDNFFNLMATPNYPELQQNMVVLNNDRGQTGYILGDTPMRLEESATEIQAYATLAPADGGPVRDTYLGLFYPSGIAPDLSGNLVAVPASHMMLRTFIRNDTVAYPWLAAAGTRRGIIDNAAGIGYLNSKTGEFVTTKTRIGIRNVLYTNFINPLVYFTGNGFLNYGNKTSYNSQSALDRTNVARLVAYIRRQLTIAARPFVFEPNDALTRQQIAGVVESLMIDLVAKRGLYDYLVVCDESNNTPARIDRNELWIDVAVEPVKAAEFIYIPVRILNTGELSGA